MMQRTRLARVATVAVAIAFAASWRGASATEIVFLNFDGDPFFEDITVDHPTGWLDEFTGSAFDLTGSGGLVLKSKISTLVSLWIAQDYAPFDITFTTTRPDQTVFTPFKTWGVDDTAYTYKTDPNDPSLLHDDARLYGKADAGLGVARTWAGSFALHATNQPYDGEGPGVISDPALSVLGDFDDPAIARVARAIANNAAHEIAHLYGVPHTTPLASSLMSSQDEGVMSTLDKIFLTDEREILFAELGARDGAPVLRGPGVEMNSGSPVSIVQTVDPVHEPVESDYEHRLAFDYWFRTTSGMLTVSLGGVDLLEFVAPATLLDDFTRHRIVVDASLLDAGPVDLVFTLDETVPGEQASIWIDNVALDGLQNGSFSTQLTSWDAVVPTAGSVNLIDSNPVPEPPTLLALAAALGLFAARGTGKRQG